MWKEFCSKELFDPVITSTTDEACGITRRIKPAVEKKDDTYYQHEPILESKGNNLVEMIIYDSNDEMPQQNTNIVTIKEASEPEAVTLTTMRSVKDVSSERNINAPQKLKSICFKIVQILNGIKSQLMNFQIPDEAAEMVRFQKKSNEFCARFSRNHLYHFELQVKEIKALNLYEPFVEWEEYTHYIYKIIDVYQILLQAITMFQRHMWLIWGLGGTVVKLDTLVNGTLELNKVSAPYQDRADISESFQEITENCLQLKESLREILEKCSDDKGFTNLKSQNTCIAANNITPMLKSAGKWKNDTLRCHCHQIPNKGDFTKTSIYHQYDISVGSAASVSGDRYSMYRTKLGNKETKKTKCPLTKGQQSAKTPKSASRINAGRKPKIPIDNCNICKESINKTKIHPRGFTNKHKDGETTTTDSLTRLSILENNKKIDPPPPPSRAVSKINKVRNPRGKYRRADVENPDTLVTHHTVSSDNLNSSKKRDVLTSAGDAIPNYSAVAGDAGVGGPASRRPSRGSPPGPAGEGGARRKSSELRQDRGSNVQLVLFSHDESLSSDSSKKTTEKKNTPNTRESKTGNSKLDIHPGSKIQRLKKLNVPQSTRDAFAAYRLQFIMHMASSPMYTSCDLPSKPWEAVARISEGLIDEMVNNVSQEMEMEDLLQQLVGLELDFML